jgi:hypothetical protein
MDRPRLRGARSIEEGRTAAEKSAVAGGTTEAIAASTSACVPIVQAAGTPRTYGRWSGVIESR